MFNKRWVFSALIAVTLLVVYFQTQIWRVEEQLRDLELSLARLRSREPSAVESPLVGQSAAPPLAPADDLVVIYNRVPKTGSTSFVGVAYDLCKKNAFKVLHVNITANMHLMTLSNQLKFAQNVSTWDAVKPALYHGHMAFLNFERLGVQTRPLYINLIRKPLDRLVSYYYFLRYGDNYRKNLLRKKHGDTTSFDECVKMNQSDCDPNNMWLQIPFFCGHAAQCWKPGNRWALEEAKKNLVQHYLLVGVTEELQDFIEVLEVSLPRMFRGASAYFLNSNRSHLRQTIIKHAPSQYTTARIHATNVWKMENELYEFAREQFIDTRKRTLPHRDPNSIVQIVNYEKIRPKDDAKKTVSLW